VTELRCTMFHQRNSSFLTKQERVLSVGALKSEPIAKWPLH
jgi:hypothetical protein